MNNKNIVPAPEGLAFRDLFQFFWATGVGNELDANGDPTPWTVESLEHAFASFGYSIDIRSIENWRSGANPPGRTNTLRLARVAAGDHRKLQESWRQEFALSTARQKDATIAATADAQPSTPSSSVGGAETGDRASEGPDSITEERSSPIRRRVVMLAGGAIATLALIGGWWFYPSSPSPAVHNITFCDIERFNLNTNLCRTNVPHFDAPIEKIYVSFQLSDLGQNEEFTRKWYRNGYFLHEKSTFNDDAWPGYTWWYFKHGFEKGEYALRIFGGGELLGTAIFTVGE